MDREFLADYEAREKEEMKKFGQRFTEGRIAKKDRYPPANRLRLDEPYTKSIDGEKIWTQIPLYASTLIPLKPTRKEIFEKVHGFDIEDIERLIDFAKKTGRIQFCLDEYPTHYVKMDFLEPVLRELNPPQLMHIPLDWIMTEEDMKKSYEETERLVSKFQSFHLIREYVARKYYESTIPEELVKEAVMKDLIRLRLLGYGTLVEEFIPRLMTIDTTRIIVLLEAIHDIFLHPYDPLKGIRSFKRQNIHELKQRFPFISSSTKEVEVPCEVGRFLNDKLKLIIPKNLDGAIELIDTYDLYDIRKIMISLGEAVEKQKIDLIKETSQEISGVFENVWSEVDTMKKRIATLRHGMSFGIGVVGAVATLPIGGIGGLLGALGFEVGEKILDVKAYEPVSERLVRLVSPSYIMHVYDFRKKYKLL